MEIPEQSERSVKGLTYKGRQWHLSGIFIINFHRISHCSCLSITILSK